MAEREHEPDPGVGRVPASARGLVAGRVVAAFLGFSALVTEVATLLAQHRFHGGNFFSYFTVEANTLAVISLVVSAFATATRSTRRGLDLYRGAVTLYMTTTILVFIVLLSGYSSSELTAVPWDNTVLHYVMPIIVIIDWLVAPPARAVAYRSALVWLAVPLAYLVYSLIRGHSVHWYPYPFVNPSQHGYLGVAVTSAVIAVILAALIWVIANTPRLPLPRST
ncbi:Pr6Pr family membrane protein [uncultured Jatrophihabitans sp.]|uniref:Pr6Pr family membrane protein n=1 Tax=uncultured Jatrophihabitans sp. TaxID=1610747 RepID=UPI0035C9AFED